MWTLTQTDDTLWYHTYNNRASGGEADGKKRRTDTPLQGPNQSEKRFKGTVEVKEEEPVTMTIEQDRKEEEMLTDYFQLNVKLGDLYREWGAADPHFKNIANIFTGESVCAPAYV